MWRGDADLIPAWTGRDTTPALFDIVDVTGDFATCCKCRRPSRSRSRSRSRSHSCSRSRRRFTGIFIHSDE